MADTTLNDVNNEQIALNRSVTLANEAATASRLFSETFKMPALNEQAVHNLTEGTAYTVGGAAIGAAILTPAARYGMGPPMAMMGGVLTAFTKGSVASGIDMGIEAATQFGLRTGLKGGAVIGLATFGAIKGYEWLNEKR
ncbi:MAG: hypothetical protein JSS86_21255 [Cyanobacteria bacterium SZAS LIN-2]|nr:hypothetical protein [Cyanobacteria bacterium SZAS LIN-2]